MMEPTGERPSNPDRAPANAPGTPSPPGAALPAAPPAKADVGKRFVAAVIDVAIALVASLIPFVGALAGTVYLVVRDGLELDFMYRRSIGKHVMKLHPVRLDGKPVDLETSFRRNWMFGLGLLPAVLLYIPVIGWILIPIAGLMALAIGVYEIYRILNDPAGRRWGDELAGTAVVEESFNI